MEHKSTPDQNAPENLTPGARAELFQQRREQLRNEQAEAARLKPIAGQPAGPLHGGVKYALGFVGIAAAVVVGMQASRHMSDSGKFSRWEAKCKAQDRGNVLSQDGKHTCLFYESGEMRVSRYDPDR